MKRRRYLVTGGCGFIGSHLAERLISLGHEVAILDDLSAGTVANAPDEAEIVVGDVVRPEILRDMMQDVAGCFHLAAVASVARSNEEPIATNRVNLVGMLNVLESARRLGGIPVVYASSAAVYGSNALMPLAETAPLRPISVYGADKLGCEIQASVATHLHGLPTAGFRFFNVYGPRQNPSSPYSGVISIFARRLRNRERIAIHGDGQQVRDFVYVDDVVDILVKAMMENGSCARVCNVCTGHGTSVIELARSLAELSDVDADLDFLPQRPGDIRVSIGDPTLTSRLYGPLAKTPLRVGLERLLRSGG